MTFAEVSATTITSCHPVSRRLNPYHSAGQIRPSNDDWGPEKDAGETRLARTIVLPEATSGKVLICQPTTFEVALMVELSAETINYRGERGYIVYGGRRDVSPCVESGSIWDKGME